MMNDFQGVVQITLLLSSLGIVASAALYMIARIFNSPETENDAKKELIESSVNILAAGLLFSLLLPMNNISVRLSAELLAQANPASASTISALMAAQPPANNPLLGLTPGDIAATTAVSAFECIKRTFPIVYGISSLTSMMSSGAHVTVQGLGLSKIGIDFEFYASMAENAFAQVLFFIFAYFLLTKLFVFGSSFGILFIAIGFILRAFAPLRGAGGYLLALGISLYFILPLTYIYGISVFWEDVGNCSTSINTNLLTAPLKSSLSNYASAAILITAIKDFILDYVRITSILFKNFCLIPLLAIGLMLTSTSIGSSVFGSRLAEIGRGLIKLI